MKKVLVALSVAVAAASANAVTVYSNDDSQVDVGGYFDVVLGKFSKYQRTDLRNNESRINFQAQHNLGNGLNVLGYARLRFDDFSNGVFEDYQANTNTFNNPVTNKLWLALEQDGIGRVSFGKQNTTGDAVQLNDNAYFLGGNNNLYTGGNKVVSFRSADFELSAGQTLGFGADYVFGDARKDTTTVNLKNAYGASLFYRGDFSGVVLNLNAGYTIESKDNNLSNNGTGRKDKSWRVASRLDFSGAKLGVEYGKTHITDSTRMNVMNFLNTHYLVGAEYQVLPSSRVFTQWKRKVEVGKTAQYIYRRTDYYIIGVDYDIAKNVTAYAQYAQKRMNNGRRSGSTKSKDSLYGVGLRVYF